jgi:O-antigen/teichoic acid export membrane protein
MNLSLSKNKFEISHQLKDPLFINSFFIILTSISGAGFGFIFWILAAKLSSAKDVGIATALISSMTLLILISKLGLDFSIIRFCPTSDKSKIFSTSIIITTLVSLIFGVIFIAGVDIFSPELHLLISPQNTLLFLIFLAANSITQLTANSFVAIRKAGFQFIQSIIVGSRIIFLFPLITLGAMGLFDAIGISAVIAVVVTLILLVKSGIKPVPVIDRKFLNESFHFSVGNYIYSLFMAGPNMIMPVMVLNMLGAEQAAYFYIAFAIASLLFMVPIAISMSLFVEGSYGEELKKTVINSLFAIFAVLVPAAIALYFGGEWVLGITGKDYAIGGLQVLRVMVIASLFMGVNQVYFAIKRIQKDISGVVVLSGVISGLLIGLGYVFMAMFGIVGVGYAWLVGNGIGSLFVGLMVWREKWI